MNRERAIEKLNIALRAVDKASLNYTATLICEAIAALTASSETASSGTDEQPQKVGGDAEILYEIAAELDEVDAKDEWPEDAPGLAEQLRDIARRLAEQTPEPSGAMTWQKSAILAGERIGKTGPDNYYSLTPEQWLEWISTPEPNRAVVSEPIGWTWEHFGDRHFTVHKPDFGYGAEKFAPEVFPVYIAPQPTAEIEEAVNGLVSAAQNLCDVADIPDPQLWSDAHERTLAALDKLKEAKHGQ